MIAAALRFPYMPPLGYDLAPEIGIGDYTDHGPGVFIGKNEQGTDGLTGHDNCSFPDGGRGGY